MFKRKTCKKVIENEALIQLFKATNVKNKDYEHIGHKPLMKKRKNESEEDDQNDNKRSSEDIHVMKKKCENITIFPSLINKTFLFQNKTCACLIKTNLARDYTNFNVLSQSDSSIHIALIMKKDPNENFISNNNLWDKWESYEATLGSNLIDVDMRATMKSIMEKKVECKLGCIKTFLYECIEYLQTLNGINENTILTLDAFDVYRPKKGHGQLISKYMELGFVPVKNDKWLKFNESNGRSLIKSIKEKNHDLIKGLLDNKNINDFVNFKGDSGFTALMYAYYNIHIVNALLNVKDIDVNIKSDIGYTALMISIKSKKIEIVDALLNVKDIDVNIKSDIGYTALMISIKSEKIEIVDRLLERNEINVNLQNNMGMSALMYAAGNENLEILKTLLEHKGINVYLKNVYGNSALMIAQKAEIKDEIRKFISAQKVK
jgi:hypothetical protein